MLLAEISIALPDVGIPAWATSLLLIIAGYLIKHYFPNLVPFLQPVLPNIPFPPDAAKAPGSVTLTAEQVMQLVHAKPQEPK